MNTFFFFYCVKLSEKKVKIFLYSSFLPWRDMDAVTHIKKLGKWSTVITHLPI